ncbi:hypothetical protein LTR53_007263 [Teratosphaeriaceae sp. CCFEE 6253]|nr:hypothetical protein LTR53_007263 [Teratosphaeriaceae sp. CCFEE 6253]
MALVLNLRRRASVPKDFGRPAHEMSPIPSQDPRTFTQQPEIELGRQHIRRTLLKSHSRAALIAVRIVRSLQILLGPVLLALTATLLSRYTTLHSQCDSDGECRLYRHAVGTFQYCVFPCLLVMVEGGVGLLETFTPAVHRLVPVVLDSMAGGFFMGAGCTLAAMLDNLSCDDPTVSGPQMCERYRAAVVLFFVGVALAYAMSLRSWYLGHRKRREGRKAAAAESAE